MMPEIEVDTTPFVTAFLIGIAFLVLWAFFRKWHRPHLGFSRIAYLCPENRPLKQRLWKLPRIFMAATLVLFLIAFIDPYIYRMKDAPDDGEKDPRRVPTEGIAIYLVLDNSRSMGEEIEISTPSGRRKNISKMQILKNVTEKFVRGDAERQLKGRPNDLIGVVTFARSAQVLAPLTLDHRAIIRQLRKLDFNRDENQLGTAIGYSIFKTANLIQATRHFGQELVQEGEPAYEIKNSIIVLVTDGFQETHPEDYGNPLRTIDIVDAAEAARDLDVTLYIINIDPQITSEKYSDHRRYFQLLTEMTGGKFYAVEGDRGLQEIYAEIDRLEKSELPQHTKEHKQHLPHLYERVSYHEQLILTGLILLFLGGVLLTTVLKRVP